MSNPFSKKSKSKEQQYDCEEEVGPLGLPVFPLEKIICGAGLSPPESRGETGATNSGCLWRIGVKKRVGVLEAM